MKTTTKLWILIGILVIFTPIGLILPAYFKSGSAWGEWLAQDRYGKTWFTYMMSGVLGVAMVIVLAFLIGKFLGKKE